MSDKDRFRRIERGRAQPLGEQVAPASLGRFSAVEQARPPAAPESVGESVNRFAPVEAAVEVEANRDDEQPFVKCAACGTEGGKFATRCEGCGASYDTPEQRAFNDRIWAERRQLLDAEKARVAERELALQAEAAHHARGQRAAMEALAHEAGDRARASWGGGSDSWSWLQSFRPLALSLLLLIPNPAVRWTVGPLALLGLAGLSAYKLEHHQASGVFGLLILAALLIPPALWGRRRRFWGWW